MENLRTIDEYQGFIKCKVLPPTELGMRVRPLEKWLTMENEQFEPCLRDEGKRAVTDSNGYRWSKAKEKYRGMFEIQNSGEKNKFRRDWSRH